MRVINRWPFLSRWIAIVFVALVLSVALLMQDFGSSTLGWIGEKFPFQEAGVWSFGLVAIAAVVVAGAVGMAVRVFRTTVVQLQRVLGDCTVARASKSAAYAVPAARFVSNWAVAANAPHFVVATVNDESAWEVF